MVIIINFFVNSQLLANNRTDSVLNQYKTVVSFDSDEDLKRFPCWFLVPGFVVNTGVKTIPLLL